MKKMETMISSEANLTKAEKILEKSQAFKIQGRDKEGRIILLIIGKYIPDFGGNDLNGKILQSYFQKTILVDLEKKPFCIVYIHTEVKKREKIPGISTIGLIYRALPNEIRENLEIVHFVHPNLQARFYFAIFGKLFISKRLYAKIKYIHRLELLRKYIRTREVDIPKFVYNCDRNLDGRPVMGDFGPESDYRKNYKAPEEEFTAYSLRNIA